MSIHTLDSYQVALVEVENLFEEQVTECLDTFAAR